MRQGGDRDSSRTKRRSDWLTACLYALFLLGGFTVIALVMIAQGKRLKHWEGIPLLVLVGEQPSRWRSELGRRVLLVTSLLPVTWEDG